MNALQMYKHLSIATVSHHLPFGLHTFFLIRNLLSYRVRTLRFIEESNPTHITGLIVYGLLFIRPMNTIWYHPDCIFGAFILFGISSYLGTYVLSKVIRRGSFAASLGIHIVLFVLYIVAYVANQFGGPADSRQYSKLQPSNLPEMFNSSLQFSL